MSVASDSGIYDLLVIGGGVNGCGIARDAAGRGYSVFLAEMNDLASGTSSGSTKLVHGGLRYLEYYQFRLVREALMEREVLLANAPHIIWPLRFVLPHHEGLRPAWLLRLGLALYDHMGGRRLLPPTRTLDLTRDAAGEPLKPLFVRAFEYSDCWVDDARLVVLNARGAADHGAEVRARTEVVHMRRNDGMWDIELSDKRRREYYRIRARLIVNAAGPWVDRVLSRIWGRSGARNVRLVKGSHIVVPKLFDHHRCYIFQNADGRIIFAIPYEDDFTLLGTTDEEFEDDPAGVSISVAEKAYLCAAASQYFVRRVSPEDVIWSYSAVRPLYDDAASKAQEVTREYVLKHEGTGDGALLNVFGGKITTYRKLAEAALAQVEPLLGRRGKSWTRQAPLPGGNFPVGGVDDLARDLQRDYPFLEARHARRLARLYGTCARDILGEAGDAVDLGVCFGSDVYEAEVRYLMAHEWAMSAEDVLWRRTKCGLRVSAPEAAALDDFIASELTRDSAAAE